MLVSETEYTVVKELLTVLVKTVSDISVGVWLKVMSRYGKC